MKEIGATIAAEVDISQAPIDTRFAELHGQPLDAFLVTPLAEKSAEVIKAIRGDGFQQVIIGGNSFNTPDMATLAAGAVEGAFVGAAWNPAVGNTESKRFVEAFTEVHGNAPDLFAAQGYSSVYLLLDAVRRAGSTAGPALQAALASIEDVDTPLGSVGMSSNREVTHDPVVQRFEAGKLVVLP
jgi:branched-chain amino acid transport system substrate-binding protein